MTDEVRRSRPTGLRPSRSANWGALLRKEGDIGLTVSSGGFTSEAEREIRSSTKHIETMDLDRLVSLWQQHYDKISEPGKVLLPLVKVHFVAPTEE